MTLSEIEDGSAVFVDSNIFIYHFGDRSAQCSNLLARCESRELRGVTSILVMVEVCHRLMMVEAVRKKLVSPGNVAAKIASRPHLIRRLGTYQNDLRAILSMGIEITGAGEDVLLHSFDIQRHYGLLTNDSMIVASMLRNHIGLLATADQQFASIREIETAKPIDI
jgi:predicted nucleic acid-binding protein